MTGDRVLGLLSAAIQDGLSIAQLPGGAILGFAIQELQKRRLAKARDILLEEIGQGDRHLIEAGEIDEIAAIIYR